MSYYKVSPESLANMRALMAQAEAENGSWDPVQWGEVAKELAASSAPLPLDAAVSDAEVVDGKNEPLGMDAAMHNTLNGVADRLHHLGGAYARGNIIRQEEILGAERALRYVVSHLEAAQDLQNPDSDVKANRLGALRLLWEHLGNVPRTGDGVSLAAPFLHFPKGTESHAVWHWFEAQDRRFVVAEAMIVGAPKGGNSPGGGGKPDNPVVIYCQEKGVFVGNFLGLGFWSMLDPGGQAAAPTFPGEQAARDYVSTWPEDEEKAGLRFVPVVPDQGDYASIEACVGAGLPSWQQMLDRAEAIQSAQIISHASQSIQLH